MKTPKRPRDLEQAIPFLLTRAGSRMGNAFAKALKRFGLHLSEWRVCASLLYVPPPCLSCQCMRRLIFQRCPGSLTALNKHIPMAKLESRPMTAFSRKVDVL